MTNGLYQTTYFCVTAPLLVDIVADGIKNLAGSSPPIVPAVAVLASHTIDPIVETVALHAEITGKIRRFPSACLKPLLANAG